MSINYYSNAYSEFIYGVYLYTYKKLCQCNKINHYGKCFTYSVRAG